MALSFEVYKARPAPFPPALVRALLAKAAEVPEIAARLPEKGSLAVRVTGDRELQRLNRSFLGEDHATDVLSFPGGGGEHLGDIAISWPAVVRQAAEHGHGNQTELALLCVHGFLHILGWDHAGPAEEAEMNRLTRLALAEAGFSLAPARLSS